MSRLFTRCTVLVYSSTPLFTPSTSPFYIETPSVLFSVIRYFQSQVWNLCLNRWTVHTNKSVPSQRSRHFTSTTMKSICPNISNLLRSRTYHELDYERYTVHRLCVVHELFNIINNNGLLIRSGLYYSFRVFPLYLVKSMVLIALFFDVPSLRKVIITENYKYCFLPCYFRPSPSQTRYEFTIPSF